MVEGADCHALKTPFHMKDVQVTKKNYAQGGTVVYVEQPDIDAIRRAGYLDIAPNILGSSREATSTRKQAKI